MGYISWYNADTFVLVWNVLENEFEVVYFQLIYLICQYDNLFYFELEIFIINHLNYVNHIWVQLQGTFHQMKQLKQFH